MTITECSESSYAFFVMEESLHVTNFGTKKVGDYFNVERSLKIGDRIDGHIVTGHIDTVGKIMKTEKKEDNSLILTVSFDKKYSTNIVKKGSITLN